jgi:hypothetical protein
MVDEYAPHHDRCQADELRAILPVDALLVDQPQVGFVDERGRLEGMVRALPSQVAGGDPAKLVVDERQHPLAGVLVAVGRVEQQLRGTHGTRFFMHGLGDVATDSSTRIPAQRPGAGG